MKLKIYKAFWGMTEELEARVERIAAAGYDGIESPLFFIEDEAKFRRLLDE